MQQLIAVFVTKIREFDRDFSVHLNKNNNLDFQRTYHTSYAQE